MAKLILTPQFGTIKDSIRVQYRIEGLPSLEKGVSYQYEFENATFSCPITMNGEFIDLNIPSYSSQAVISVFANIYEEQIDGRRTLKEICPAIFYVVDKKTDKVDGKVEVSPLFASAKDVCSIKVSSFHSKKIIFSINDKRMPILLNEEGNGSIHFVGKDIMDLEHVSSLQKMPIYLYSEKDNFVKKSFTGYYINILPDSIASYAEEKIDPRCLSPDYTPGGWTYAVDAPPECFGSGPEIPGTVEPIEPGGPGIDIPTQSTEDQNGGEGIKEIYIQNTCRIHNQSITLLNNGKIAHAYLNVDSSIVNTSSPYYNKNRITVLDNWSSLTVPVISRRDVVIAPKEAYENFSIYTDKDIYDAMSDIEDVSMAEIYVLFYNSSIGYCSAKIIDRSFDVYTDSYVLVAEDETSNSYINAWLFCVDAVFYKRNETAYRYLDYDSEINTNLGYVKDRYKNVLQTNKVSIASNSSYASEYDESYIYLIAESQINGESQLFFASAVFGEDFENITEEDLYYGWKQITFSGNNINPKTYMDQTNTLHVFWESDRSGSWQIYYGCLGTCNKSMNNAVFSSMVDKQAEMIEKTEKPTDYLSDRLLKDVSKIDPSFPVPSSVMTEVIRSTKWVTEKDNYGSVVESNGSTTDLSNLTITGNVLDDMAMAFVQVPISDTLFDRIPIEGENISIPYSQINYQTSFDMSVSLIQPSGIMWNWNEKWLSKEEIDNLYEGWKDEFTMEIDPSRGNIPVFVKEGNKYILGREDNIYDRIVPFYGSYNATSLIVQDPSDVDNFQIKITKVDSTLKDFMFGIMFEKSRFKATNALTFIDHNIESLYEYIPEETHIIYTGKAKLIALVKTEDNDDYISNYYIFKEFPESFDILSNHSYEIVSNYTKIDSAEVSFMSNTYGSNYENRFIGNVTLLIDGEAKFSQSFVATISHEKEYFDLGFGIPYGGYCVADQMTPSTAGIFDDIKLTMNISNTSITSPTYEYNGAVSFLPLSVRNSTEFRVIETGYNPSNLFSFSLLNLGFYDEEKTISSERILRCYECASGNGAWSKIYDVSDIDRLTFTLDTGGEIEKSGITVTDNITKNVFYNTGLLDTSSMPGRIYTEDIDVSGYSSIVIAIIREIENEGYVDLNLNFKTVISDNLFSAIPISMEGINKAPSTDWGTCSDSHVVWQSNRGMYWDIYYSNCSDKLRPFRFDTRITSTKSNSLMPAIAVNRNGTRMVVWHDNRDNNFGIYGCRSLQGLKCDEISCQNKMVEKYEDNITECSLEFSFIPSGSSYYIFSIEFYTDHSLTDLFKTISSSTDMDGWYINNVSFESLASYSSNEVIGIPLEGGTEVVVSYIPSKEDNIFDRILFADLVEFVV